MNFLTKLFPPKEIKAAIGILNEVDQALQNHSFNLVRGHIENIIFKHPNDFVDSVNKGKTPREWIYSSIANISGDLLESGQYHLYRGVINPVGPGSGLRKIFDYSIDELVKIEIITQEKADEEKNALGKNILEAG